VTAGNGAGPQAVPGQAAYDTANGLLALRPAQLATTTLAPPGQPAKVCLTIRTETTTLTVLLSKGEAEGWASQIATEATALSDGGLIAGKG